MRILDVTLPASHRIAFISDLHFGNRLQYRKGIDRMMAAVLADPECFVFILGDIGESVSRSHKHFERAIHDSTITIAEQYARAAKVFKPIRERVKLVLSGNHDRRTDEVLNPVLETFCKDLDIQDTYGTEQAKVIIRSPSGKVAYRVYCQHGRESITSTAEDPVRRHANMILQLKRQLNRPGHSDCLVMAQGHTHWLAVQPPIATLSLYGDSKLSTLYRKQVDSRASYIDETLRWYVSTGSFLKKSAPEGLMVDGERMFVSSYAEYFRPNVLGYSLLSATDGEVKVIDEVIVS